MAWMAANKEIIELFQDRIPVDHKHGGCDSIVFF